MKVYFLFAVIFIFSSPIFAQINISEVQVKIGTIKTFYSNYSYSSNYERTFYPEIQIGGKFFDEHLKWGIYFGHWDDGVDKAFPVADNVTYSYSSNILGLRIYLSPKIKRILPFGFSFFAGAAHHFIFGKYVGGYSLTGRGYDFTDKGNTLEAGLQINYHIYDFLKLVVEANQFFPIGNSSFATIQKGRNAFKAGLLIKF